MTVRVEVAGFTKAFGEVQALAGMDLAVEAGETVAILGPSGCGKTTLLRAVAGLDPPDRGTVHLGGHEVTHLPPGSRDMAMVFQNHALLPHLSVAENIVFGLRARRLPGAESEERLTEAAALSGCDHLLARRPAQLSGGERQRVALARALARRPAVLLLDEPLASLDMHLRSRLRVDLGRVLAELGVTAVHVTHDQGEAQALGNRIAVMDEGRVRQVATPDEIYDHPVDRFVAEFVGVPPINLLAVTDGDPPRAGPFPLDRLPPGLGAELDAGVRPEAIRLVADARGIASRVESVVPGGADAVVTVAAAGHRLVVLVARQGRPVIGERLAVTIERAPVLLFDRASGVTVGECRAR